MKKYMFIESDIEIYNNIKHKNRDKQISLYFTHSVIFLKNELYSYNKKSYYSYIYY